jgi:tetratricopeptide (TPR) repeat protein
MAYCPNCGSKLETEFNFCPSCGFDLQNKIKNASNDNLAQTEVIVCDNCGVENPEGASVCEGCGVKLKGETKTVTRSTIETEPKKSDKNQRTKKKQRNVQQSSQQVKEIDSKKIIGILAAILVGVFIILFATGVFDKPSSPGITNLNQVPNQQSPGVDLGALQRINELEERVKNNPNDSESLLQLAHLRNDSGMFEKAIENYQQYLNAVPDNADARVDMGVCYYSLRRYDDAIREMTKALEYKPDHQIAHLNLGIVNLAAGNIDKSKEWLRKAVNLNPNTEIGKRAQELLNSH